MKIIKPGRDQKGWAAEHACTGKGNSRGGCGAILLVEQNDLYTTTSGHYDEFETMTTFLCPQCGVQTDIDRPPGITVHPDKKTMMTATYTEPNG